MAPQYQLLASLLVTIILALGRPATTGGRGRREVVSAEHGAVAADDLRCSRIGRDVLAEGGNAVDAAVAAALCLGVVSCASSGIGGGAFMVVRRSRDGAAVAYDMRETAPSMASQDMYAGNSTLKASGSLSIGVPGEVAGLHIAWKQHGKLPWKRLVSPAAALARNGFRISPYLHMQMERTESAIFGDKGLRDIFTSSGKLLKIGDVAYNKKLAETLDCISQYGPEALYNGSIADKLVRDVREAGGIITLEDMRNYRVKFTEPLVTDVMGLTILGMPPPSAGGAGMVLILNILEQYGFPSGIDGSLGLHRFIESLKHMFAVRMNLGDPDFVNVTKIVSDMLSPQFARELKKTIYDNKTFSPKYYGGRWNQIYDHGTSHLSVVDSERNAVSMTSTVNGYFGSLILSPSTGILLNNEMDDFSIPASVTANVPPPAPANFIRPLKRPLSSMSPTIVLKDGQLLGVVGASGGAMITAATTEVFLNHFAKGMDPFSSIMAPRSYHQLIPNVVMYENWTTITGDHFEVPVQIRADLEKKGHILEPLAGGTICQFIVHHLDMNNITEGDIIHGLLTAVSDPRKGGVPAAF